MSRYDTVVKMWQDWNIRSVDGLSLRLDNFCILFAYHSGKIENAEINYHDTREIFENGKVVGYTGSTRTLFEQQNQKVCYDRCTERISVPEFQRFHAMGLCLLFVVEFLYGDNSGDDDLMSVKGQLDLPLLVGDPHGLKPTGRERYLVCFRAGSCCSSGCTAVDPRQTSFHVTTPFQSKYIIFGTNSQYFGASSNSIEPDGRRE